MMGIKLYAKPCPNGCHKILGMALLIKKSPVQLGTIGNKSRMTEGSSKGKIDLNPQENAHLGSHMQEKFK